MGDAAVFSFYPTKSVPVGEGGMVITRSKALARDLAMFRNYGKYKDEGATVIRYTGNGFNFRMDEWTAAVACHQMERLSDILDLRRADAEALSKVVAPLVTWDETNWYKFIVDSSFPAKKQTGKVYAHTDQAHTILALNGKKRFKNADLVASKHICLPIGEWMYSGMSSGDIEQYLLGE